MSIKINKDKCIKCNLCLNICPGNLIGLDENGRAEIIYPKDCWGCCSCVKECQYDAISLYLGADIGGKGSLLNIKKQGDILNWKIEKANGNEVIIQVDSKESNKY